MATDDEMHQHEAALHDAAAECQEQAAHVQRRHGEEHERH
jgi:hypothetical protein